MITNVRCWTVVVLCHSWIGDGTTAKSICSIASKLEMVKMGVLPPPSCMICEVEIHKSVGKVFRYISHLAMYTTMLASNVTFIINRCLRFRGWIRQKRILIDVFHIMLYLSRILAGLLDTSNNGKLSCTRIQRNIYGYTLLILLSLGNM